MPAGRHTDYSDDLAGKILERLSDGESLRSICRDETMPAKSTIFNWLASNVEFEKRYRLAREIQAESLFDELMDIADDGTNDWMVRKNADGQMIGWQENGEALRRSVLRVDARKWAISKMLPRKYGDKQQVEHTGGISIVISASDAEL